MKIACCCSEEHVGIVYGEDSVGITTKCDNFGTDICTRYPNINLTTMQNKEIMEDTNDKQ